jgi:Arc/MetJ-type ribon-helix-helix transcriptional regulator
MLTRKTPKPVDEKLTLNISCVDLGQIDLLVQEGFYANRSDLIRMAIRNQIATHADVVRQVVTRKSIVLGIQHYSVADLERAREAGERLQIRVLGLAVIAPEVTPELALAAIESVTVLGALHASPAVKTALVGRLL